MHYMSLVFCRWPAPGAPHMLLLPLHFFPALLVGTGLSTAFNYEHILDDKQLPWYNILTDGWNNFNRYVGDFFIFKAQQMANWCHVSILWRSRRTM